MASINVSEKVRNYQGTNSFIHNLKSGLNKYGKLTPKQYDIAEKILIKETRDKEFDISDVPEHIRPIVEYNGENEFVNDLKSKYIKYRKLTERQVSAALKAIDRDVQKKSQRELNISLKGETIKIGRKIAVKIKEDYNLEFHPILVDVTEVMIMSNKAFKLKAKLTKDNGGICRCCGKTLTTEVSRLTGIGPICSKYFGVPYPVTKEQVEKYKSDVAKKIDEIGEFEFWIPKRSIVKWEGPAGVLLKF